jgi:ATP-binding cassette subfamily F protein 3
MLSLKSVSCGYGDTVIVRDVERTVLAGQRIGILGANGQGKSTLVKTIARVLPPVGGTITEGKGLAIGYFAQQEMDLLDEDDTPMQRMVRLAREVSPSVREQELRNFLGQFRFEGAMVDQRVGTLSGGERARLVLATIVWQRPNLLLLDEPTNHLDLNTREALSIALNEFEGTVLLVSHDRALLREVCDEFWLVSRGGIAPFDGDIDDYQQWLLEHSRAMARGLPAPQPSASSATTEPPRRMAAAAIAATPTPPRTRDDRKARAQARSRLADLTRPLRIEIARIDERLARLADERASRENELSTGLPDAAMIADHGRQLDHIAAEVAMLEERWLQLHEQLDSLMASDV